MLLLKLERTQYFCQFLGVKMEKAMATYSVFLPWGLQGWGSTVGCSLWGRTGVRHR